MNQKTIKLLKRACAAGPEAARKATLRGAMTRWRRATQRERGRMRRMLERTYPR